MCDEDRDFEGMRYVACELLVKTIIKRPHNCIDQFSLSFFHLYRITEEREKEIEEQRERDRHREYNTI